MAIVRVTKNAGKILVYSMSVEMIYNFYVQISKYMKLTNIMKRGSN